MSFQYIAAAKASSNSAGTSLNCTSTLNVQAGDLLVGVIVWESGAGGTVAIAQTDGNNAMTMTGVITNDSGNQNFLTMGYVLSATAASSATFRMTNSTSRRYRAIIVYQFRPDAGEVVSLDAGPAANSGSTGTVHSSTNFSVTGNDVAAVFATKTYNSQNYSSMTIAGTTATRNNIFSYANAFHALITAPISNTLATTTGSNSSWAAQTLLFKSVPKLPDDLTTSSIVSNSVVSTPSLSLIHPLNSNSITSNSLITTSNIKQIHTLTSNNIISNDTITIPSVQQIHTLTTSNIISNDTITIPTLSQIFSLITSNITSNSNIVKPSIKQIHTLTTSNIISNDTITIPSIQQVHTLASNNVISNSNIIKPSIQQIHTLTTNNVISNSNIIKPSIQQIHTLTTNNIISNNTIIIPSVQQIHFFTFNSITSSPIINNTNIQQVHTITSNNIISNSIINKPSMAKIYSLDTNSIISNSSITIPSIQQIHILTSNNIISNSIINKPSMAKIYAFDTNSITSSSNIVKPNIQQIHTLITNSITSTPIINSSSIKQIHTLTTSNIISNDTITIPSIQQIYNITVNEISVAPTITIPNIKQIHTLTTNNIISNDTITIPSIQQNDFINCSNIETTNPIVNTTTLNQETEYKINPTSIEYSIEIPTNTFIINSNFNINSLTTIPSISVLNLKQNNKIVSTDIQYNIQIPTIITKQDRKVFVENITLDAYTIETATIRFYRIVPIQNLYTNNPKNDILYLDQNNNIQCLSLLLVDKTREILPPINISQNSVLINDTININPYIQTITIKENSFIYPNEILNNSPKFDTVQVKTLQVFKMEDIMADDGGATEIVEAVWNRPIKDHMKVGSFGEFIQKKLLTVNKYIGLK